MKVQSIVSECRLQRFVFGDHGELNVKYLSSPEISFWNELQTRYARIERPLKSTAHMHSKTLSSRTFPTSPQF